MTSASPDIEALLGGAQQAVEAGDWQAARASFEAALERRGEAGGRAR